jgi:hypothetical protein
MRDASNALKKSSSSGQKDKKVSEDVHKFDDTSFESAQNFNSKGLNSHPKESLMLTQSRQQFKPILLF